MKAGFRVGAGMNTLKTSGCFSDPIHNVVLLSDTLPSKGHLKKNGILIALEEGSKLGDYWSTWGCSGCSQSWGVMKVQMKELRDSVTLYLTKRQVSAQF